MGFKIPSYTEFTLTAGGGTENLSPDDTGDYYLITGTVTLTSNWTFQYDPGATSPVEGMTCKIIWRAVVTLGGNSITMFGNTLTDEQVSKQGSFDFEYDGSNWQMRHNFDFEESNFITEQIKPDVTNGTSIATTEHGVRLTSDETTPDDGDVYAFLTNKGWKSIGDLMDLYDSGWINLPTYNSGTGYGTWQHTTNHPEQPQVRFIGRLAMFRGRIVVPLDNGAGAAYTDYEDVVYSGYDKTTVNTADSGIDAAFSSEDFPIKFAPMFSSNNLYPDQESIVFPADAFRLVSTDGANTGKILRLGAACALRATTDGRLAISGLLDREHADSLGVSGSVSTGGSDTWLPHDKWRSIASVVTTSDYVLDLKNTDSFIIDSTVPLEGTPTPGTLGTPGANAIQYPLDFDGTDPRSYGGLSVRLNGLVYPIKATATLDQIKTAWSAL